MEAEGRNPSRPKFRGRKSIFFAGHNMVTSLAWFGWWHLLRAAGGQIVCCSLTSLLSAARCGEPTRICNPALSGVLIVACRSTSAQSSDDFNPVSLRLVSMLELVLLGLVPSTHFGKELHRA